MASVKLPILITTCLVACGGDKHEGQPDAPDQIADCGGTTDRFLMTGPFTIDTPNFGFVTVNSKIAGMMGAATPSTDIAALTLGNVIANDLESDHDIASANLKYIREPLNSHCSDTATCEGFFAMSGSYHVVALTPRYQATFTLGDLHEHHSGTDQPGPAIAGTISGCVNHAPP